MNKFFYSSMFLLICLLFFTTSCTDVDSLELSMVDEDNTISHTLSEENAVKVASQFFRNTQTLTRMSDDMSSISEVKVLKHSVVTRSASTPDTVAYIVNFKNDGGFVIVSAKGGVFPILGYSQTGNFAEIEDGEGPDILKRIESYVDAHGDERAVVTSSGVQWIETKVEPFVNTKLSQRSPYDKYVIEEYPGCPVGCGAIAVANAFLYGTKTMTYHGRPFYCKSLREAIENDHVSGGRVPSNEIVSPQIVTDDEPALPYYTKSQAQIAVARMLYYIGQDLNMDYQEDISVSNFSDAFSLVNNQEAISASAPYGYGSSGYRMYSLLDNGYLIIVRGENPLNKNDGHMWNIDGYQEVYDTSSEAYPYACANLLHCDFGWGGSWNGYYNSDLLGIDFPYYQLSSFFGVKCNL